MESVKSIAKSISRFLGFLTDDLPPESFTEGVEEPIDEDQRMKQIRLQIEFYLSPSNIAFSAYDKALIEEREDRFVDVSKYMNYRKLQELKATEDDILHACQASRKLEVDMEHRMIRTIQKYEPDPRREYRMINIRGLDQTETLDHLKTIFDAMFPPEVLYIQMRNKNINKDEKVFSGEVNVELISEEMAQEAIKRGIEYNGKNIIPELYVDVKAKFSKHKKQH